MDGRKSPAKMITYGMPQGSCLGPLPFIIYLDDLETCLESSEAGMYADHAYARKLPTTHKI